MPVQMREELRHSLPEMFCAGNTLLIMFDIPTVPPDPDTGQTG